ncbi:hypothetical protein [Vibrio sp. MA64]|uniref:hypothetical protein n=1 Tax=Vibrio sp. MA64 TaxID=2896365 RepID=UPI001E2FEFD2|nr:hypothetical protein [Vibrio sp. MA64]MCC9651033.1 hypothetical protein [Vibrio sp. MA64]
MNNKSKCTDQADGLRYLMKKQVCAEKLRAIQSELRRALIARKYKEADVLMEQLSRAQEEFEDILYNCSA